jgi:hypothetical protein
LFEFTKNQVELQGESPGAVDLWDEVSPGVFKPKDENRLSDYVARHLRRDLSRKRGIIVNREVEIRRGSGGAEGERTDLKIEARTLEPHAEQFGLVTVIVEVKGCWHRHVNSAMQVQLRDRYLKENPCRHGLFLVGWHCCPQWKADKPSQNSVRFKSLDSLRKALCLQASNIAREDIVIKACVINAALILQQQLFFGGCNPLFSRVCDGAAVEHGGQVNV